MKKRMLSWLLILVMVAALLPGTALATEEPVEAVDQGAVMDAIAAKLTRSEDSWTVLDMARYAALPGKSVATTDEARQDCLDALIATAAGETATVSDRARIEIVLRAMGVDSKELYPAGKTEAVDNAGALAAMDLTSGGFYAAPYVLLAVRQGNVQLTQTQTDSLVKLLADGVGDGLFEWEWDGTTYTDPDTAGAALAALASYDTAEARSVKDKILAALPGALGEGGTFGSANSDAMVILGLLAVDQDPRELKTEDGASVVDGLLSYVNETRDGFVYAGEENALATEQGFRALVALAMYDGEGSVDFYDFSTNAVTPGKATEVVDQNALMDAIAARLAGSEDSWTVLDLVRYSALPGKTAATTAQARQSCLDALIATAAGETATVSDRARIEIVLRAMGVDSKELYPAGKTKAVDNAGALAAMDLTTGGFYAAPYVLLAARQGNVQLTQTQTDSLVKLLADGVGDGLFEWEWDGAINPDPDTAGAALAALANYDTAEAQAVKDKILAALPKALGEGGTFGSANSDAMVILGLLAVGRDPAELKTEAGASVVDGLLSYVNETGDGFVYAGAENALATEQGFRALVALAMYDGEGSVDFYDFSTNAVTPGKATGAEGPDRPKPPTPSGDKTVAVTFTLKTHTETWVSATTLKLTQGATVYHALTKVMAANGITAVGADAGYVTSMTYRGKTLAEFDNGPNSGWLYQVNGQAPNVPFNAYTLKDGDEVLWYYAADWTRDPAASRPISGGHGGSVGVGGKENETTEEPEKPQETDKTIWPFADVTEGEWFYPGVKTVYEKGLVMGTDASHFSPDMTTTRAMVLTILARLDTQDLSGGDVWYDKAVAWAVNKGVSDGTAPEHDITREQLAAMLMRYAGETPPENTGLDAFSDAGAVSNWARPAMVWATDRGILTGKPGSRLDPQGPATRAELCAVLHRYLTGEKGPAPQQPDLRAQILAQKAGAAASWLLKAVPEPRVGDVGGEWTVLALAQIGSADRDYLNAYLAAAKDTVAAKGGYLTSRKYTEYSRLVLTLAALGADPRDVAGYDLTAPLCDYDAVVRQGLNGAAWALMALDSGAYSDDQTRQRYVELLLERQLPQGGWSLTGEGEPEADVTGMVLRALAPHRGQERVDQAVERALEALSAQQNADGSFSSWGQPTAESCAQVILALDALDMELRDARFVKNGCTALDGLLGFCTQDGGFAHTTGGKADLMATEQALLALAACLD